MELANVFETVSDDLLWNELLSKSKAEVELNSKNLVQLPRREIHWSQSQLRTHESDEYDFLPEHHATSGQISVA